MKYLVSHDSRHYALYRTLFPWQAAALENMLRLAAARGVPVQPLAGVYSKHLLSGKHPGSWVICRYIPGEPLLGKATVTQISTLGTTLAGLHGIEARRPRRLMGMFASPFSYRMQLVMELRAHLSRFSPPLLEKNRKLRSWMDSHVDTLGRLPLYPLTHGDLYAQNVIVNGPSVALIDYEHARFEPGGFELATALLRTFCIQDKNLQYALLGSYLSHCSARSVTLWNDHYPFFLLVAAMRLYSGRIRRMKILTRRAQDTGEQLRMALIYQSWAVAIANTIRAHHAYHPSLDDMLSCCGK